MAYQVNLGWDRNSATPLFDQGYKSGGRPVGGGGSFHLSGGQFPLEISQPQPGLSTLNRYYKAYPGLLYEVRMSVIGGYFPYSYELTTAPAGMTIDARGEITWTNPVETGSPHTVTAQVTDANGAVDTVTWTITVTTAGFRFIDAVNGTAATSGGDGSISNPWRSMVDWYGGTLNADKTTNPYAGEFLYWRSGTYQVDAHLEDSPPRLPLVGDNKPQVWLAYPGETPLIDLQNAFINVYAGGDNVYFDGLSWNSRSARAMGVVLESGSNNVVLRKNTMYGIVGGSIGGNNAHIFIGNNDVAGSNWAIQDNELYDVDEGYGLLGYTATNVLVEDNVIYNIGSHAIGPKEGTDRWVIRQNDLSNNATNSIGLQYSDTSGFLSGDMEICYNLIKQGGGTVRINSNFTDNGLPVYTYRNTIIANVDVNDAQATNGPFSFTENVIVNETAFPEKIERVAITDPSRVIVTDNLTGSAADNIVDANGELTAGYSEFIGIRGHKIVEIA